MTGMVGQHAIGISTKARRSWFGVITLAAVFLAASCASVQKPASALDVKITNGRIVDGTGAPWFRADVGIRGDTIVALGKLDNMSAATTIDAHDQVVSPGFIDLLGQSQNAVLVDPKLEAKVRQGVTTEVTGEGFSPGPEKAPVNPQPNERTWPTLRSYLDAIDQQGAAINFAFLVGASNPREMVIGDTNRPPTADEMREMEAIVDQAMRDGAIGISTSLIYLPAMYSTTEEIVNLTRVAARYGGMYFTHMRDEGDKIDEGLDEAFRVGREANIPVNIWHLKVGGRANWGKMPHVIQRIDEARASGLDVAANMYPYVASATSLSTLAPDWALEGGYKAFQQRLADPAQRPRILEGFAQQAAKRGEKGIYVARVPNRDLAQYEKHFLHEIATMMGTTPEEALARLFEQNDRSPSVIFFSMDEGDVQYALKQPYLSLGADSGSPTPAAREANSAVHPRAYGTFTRVAGHYVRDIKLFSIEEAVRKMSSQAADRAHLDDRGIIRPGMKADVIVFDPATIRDVATFDDPHHFSEGISNVIVNGVPVLRDGAMTSALPGHTLRGKGYEGRKK